MGIGIVLCGLASGVANMGGIGIISTVGIGLINNNSNVNMKVNHIDGMIIEGHYHRLIILVK